MKVRAVFHRIYVNLGKCMVYLPTFYHTSQPSVCEYSIRGSSGFFCSKIQFQFTIMTSVEHDLIMPNKSLSPWPLPVPFDQNKHIKPAQHMPGSHQPLILWVEKLIPS